MGHAAANRPRKRRRRNRAGAAVAAGEGPDRFSSLNDDLLRNITNLLPTRTAAKLAAVSRHFRAQVPGLLDRVDSLTLHEPHFPVPLRDAPPLLLRRLAITPHRAIPPASFHPMLATAAEHGVSELNVRLTRRARLPKNLLSLRSLVVLTLETCAVPSWSTVALPCLRTLRLQRVAVHQAILNGVFASATCLETLHMMYCTGLGTGKGGGCTVESSSVRNFVFRPPLKQEEAAIRASGLRTVTLYTRSKTRRLELAAAPDVKKAYLHIAKPQKTMESFRVRPFLDAGTRLECLTLRCQAMKMLSTEYEDSPILTVMFQNLRILSVSLDLSSEGELVFLQKLLESCPNLKQFSLSAAETDRDNAAETDKGNAAETDTGNALPCFFAHKERLANISCLTNSLVRFKFLGFKPRQYQKKLIVFLLTRAKNLKKVGVGFEKSQEAAVKKILSVKRAPIERTSRKYTNYYMELEY
ncbi:hypothetical protein ACP70R_038345 [Stipagrostis hirtigluma subsp. patula]